MEINVGIKIHPNNKQVLKTMIIRVDLAENEVIAIDQDFQDRMAEEIKPIIEHEIEGTREMD
jgi:hypothetical protein